MRVLVCDMVVLCFSFPKIVVSCHREKIENFYAIIQRILLLYQEQLFAEIIGNSGIRPNCGEVSIYLENIEK